MPTSVYKMRVLNHRSQVVGGFPEVVAKFIETSNLQDVYYLHESIDKLYKLDISFSAIFSISPVNSIE